jgi:hypothetical protein
MLTMLSAGIGLGSAYSDCQVRFPQGSDQDRLRAPRGEPDAASPRRAGSCSLLSASAGRHQRGGGTWQAVSEAARCGSSGLEMSSRCAAVAPGLLRSRSAALNIRGDVQGKDSIFRPSQDVVLHVLLGSKFPKSDKSSLFLLNSFIIRRGAAMPLPILPPPRGGRRPGEREQPRACGTRPMGVRSRHLQAPVTGPRAPSYPLGKLNLPLILGVSCDSCGQKRYKYDPSQTQVAYGFHTGFQNKPPARNGGRNDPYSM